MPALGQTISYYGTTVTLTSWTGGIISYYPTVYPGGVSMCTGLYHAGKSWIVFGAPFTYELTFATPVNNISILIDVLNVGDNFTITTDAGVPSIAIMAACGAHVSGNQIISDPNPPGFAAGDGEFKITAPSAFTVLTVAGTSYGNGGNHSLGCDTSAPPSTTTTTTTTLAPTGFNTIYTSFDVY